VFEKEDGSLCFKISGFGAGREMGPNRTFTSGVGPIFFVPQKSLDHLHRTHIPTTCSGFIGAFVFSQRGEDVVSPINTGAEQPLAPRGIPEGYSCHDDSQSDGRMFGLTHPLFHLIIPGVGTAWHGS